MKLWWLVFPAMFATSDSVHSTVNDGGDFQYMVTNGGRYVWHACDSSLFNFPSKVPVQFSIGDSISTDIIYTVTPTN